MIARIVMPDKTLESQVAALQTIQGTYDSRFDHLDRQQTKIFDLLDSLKSSVENLKTSRGSVQWTNLMVSGGAVFAAVMFSLSLISNPMRQQIEINQNRLTAAETLITTQRGLIGDLRLENSSQEMKITTLHDILTDIKDHGSPITDRRLTLLEHGLVVDFHKGLNP